VLIDQHFPDRELDIVLNRAVVAISGRGGAFTSAGGHAEDPDRLASNSTEPA
jgi:hypothetical protein